MSKLQALIAGALFALSSASLAITPDERDLQVSADRDHMSSLNKLLQRGVDPNVGDKDGNSALMIALRGESYQAVERLIAHAATDVNKANVANETPLMFAALRGRLDLVKKLVERGAKVNREGWTPLHYASSGPDNGVAAWLLEQGAEIDARAPNGSTPLMMAVRYAPIATAELLLAKGANVRLSHENGNTAADFAASAGRDALAAKVLAAAR
ncbi:ankyrin repeat domain-containing protein [Roseateles microcysteis]|uniref:ankyrin repeat domain-containing protein n=1 Tax=Roseateles microcysteis TaxID=3119057 RepID=UPI002FE5E429